MARKKIFTKENILTIPNLLSVIRLLIIPFICLAYFKYKNYIVAASLVVLSAVTDIADGIIARKCNMISDVGKMLDPFADKLTEGILILVLSFTYKFMFALVATFAVFEIAKAVLGSMAVKKTGEVKSAKWFGKLNTVYLYETLLVMIIFRNIDPLIVNIKVSVAYIMTVTSFVLYAITYCGYIFRKKDDAGNVVQGKTEASDSEKTEK